MSGCLRRSDGRNLFYSTRNLVECQVEIKHSANRARNQTSWVVDDIGPPIWNDARVNTKGNCGVAANLSKVGLNDHGAKFAPWWVPVIALGRGLFQLNISSEGARNDRTRVYGCSAGRKTTTATQRPNGCGNPTGVFTHWWRPYLQPQNTNQNRAR